MLIFYTSFNLNKLWGEKRELKVGILKDCIQKHVLYFSMYNVPFFPKLCVRSVNLESNNNIHMQNKILEYNNQFYIQMKN